MSSIGSTPNDWLTRCSDGGARSGFPPDQLPALASSTPPRLYYFAQWVSTDPREGEDTTHAQAMRATFALYILATEATAAGVARTLDGRWDALEALRRAPAFLESGFLGWRVEASQYQHEMEVANRAVTSVVVTVDYDVSQQMRGA